MPRTRGDISLFIVIVVGTMMLGGAVLLSLILARQNSLTEDIVASERAFYAASAGAEQGFYELALADGDIAIDVDGMVDYDTAATLTAATYQGKIARQAGQVCGSIVGTFAGEQRRIQVGPEGCSVE